MPTCEKGWAAWPALPWNWKTRTKIGFLVAYGVVAMLLVIVAWLIRFPVCDGAARVACEWCRGSGIDPVLMESGKERITP